MKFNYLFVDHNNGHETTYHPFSSNTLISQERVTKLLNTIPGANRMGTHLGHLLDLLDKENLEFEEFHCPCCDKKVHILNNFDLGKWERQTGIKWQLLEGITGNY